MVSDAMHSNGQKSSRWAHEDQCHHPSRGGTRNESFAKTPGCIMTVIRGRNGLGQGWAHTGNAMRVAGTWNE
jgi:hypothetical protein